jgi:toxin ParE1/3/4
MSIQLHPQAEADVAAAARFYRQTGAPRIASRFITEFHRVARLLVEQPGLGTPLSGGRRRQPMNVFPYAVIYRISATEIRILAVKHDRQHPRFGATRK